METPQHGNGPESEFWVSFHLFSRIIRNPSKTKYLGLVSSIFTFDSFPVFFGSVSSFFGSVSGFQKKFLTLSLLIGFLFFLGQFLVFRKSFKLAVCWSVSPFYLFLGQFPVFRKSFKLSVCWSVSPFFGSVSSFFGSVSDFQKKLQILSLLIGFLFF